MTVSSQFTSHWMLGALSVMFPRPFSQDHHTLLTGPPHPPYRTTTPSQRKMPALQTRPWTSQLFPVDESGWAPQKKTIRLLCSHVTVSTDLSVGTESRGKSLAPAVLSRSESPSQTPLPANNRWSVLSVEYKVSMLEFILIDIPRCTPCSPPPSVRQRA